MRPNNHEYRFVITKLRPLENVPEKPTRFLGPFFLYG